MEQLSALFELASSLATCHDRDALNKNLVAHLSRRLHAEAVFVWLWDEDGEGLSSRGRWTAAGTRFELSPGPVREGFLVEMLQAPRPTRRGAREIAPDQLLHIAEADRKRVVSTLYAPLLGPSGPAGVIEVLNGRGGEFTADDAAFAQEAGRLTGRALESLQALEQERHASLSTIGRLTSLYDLGRIFNSTLELQNLLPILVDKVCEILGAEACNLWLVDDEAGELYFAHQAGEDPTTKEGTRVPVGEGIIGQVAQKGEGRLIATAEEEPDLAGRLAATDGFSLRTLMCAPLLKDEDVLGVVEVVNKTDGEPFDEDDLFFLTSISGQAAIALHNANLLESERKVHELDALLAISKEITSTLNLDHVLTTVVHQAATVVPFDRCVIGLFDRNRFILGAVSGEPEVPRTREMDELRALLERISNHPDAVSADHYVEGWEVSVEEIRDDLVRYLEERQSNGFYALPLRDEQGPVGVLALLSGDGDFLTENHRETLSILGSQTTVAIRNARLYQEVPLISVWRPLAERKKKLLAATHGRWMEIGGRVGLAALALIAVPWKLRVEANATVVPAQRRTVSARVQGVIRRVWVWEGEQVAAGTALAELDDSDNRMNLENATVNLDLARRQLADDEARHDLAGASQSHLRIEMYAAEADLYKEKVEDARLRAPIAGVVVTPKVEEKVGKFLKQGDPFCELVDQERMAVEMSVPETQVALIKPGAGVALKLNAFPSFTFGGTVERLGAQTVSAEGEQYFLVRATFANAGEVARTGMVGLAKITSAGGWFDSGWYPVGYCLFRAPARWAWRKAWSWLP